jgi:hypothetical protein
MSQYRVLEEYPKREGLISKAIVVCMFLILTIQGYGQLMSVQDFSSVPSSTEARLNPQYDWNGNECALIRVQTTIDNLIFDTEDMSSSIVHVIDTIAEYWVYVSGGSRSLVLKHDYYGILRYMYPMKINELEVYTLQLTGNTNTDVKDEPVGTVSITSSPSGATVFINDEKAGFTTPMKLEDMPVGVYEIRVEKTGFESITKAVLVAEDITSEVDYFLPIAKGVIVTLTSTPSGANLYIDDEYVGSTPFMAELGAGTYTYRIEYPDYKTEIGEFKVKSQEGPLSMNYELHPLQ